ncbi:hypothetical protein K443DRAFT_15958 [Laccaria amethystina LaAM-08-1]|uniref:Uncharacterized protein n=1 Tax=Laccaria amethystina LaAM-08-1 TaxID=1095629 RepID=A0A0C9WWE2_9AGAR|nr:hypothetical protein K443DRAFT_15958 [Laccaria amethystina LaAM-08-1]
MFFFLNHHYPQRPPTSTASPPAPTTTFLEIVSTTYGEDDLARQRTCHVVQMVTTHVSSPFTVIEGPCCQQRRGNEQRTDVHDTRQMTNKVEGHAAVGDVATNDDEGQHPGGHVATTDGDDAYRRHHLQSFS